MADDQAMPATTDRAADVAESTASAAAEPARRRRRGDGVVARVFKGIFGGRGDDIEKRLQWLSREENAVHARLKRRARAAGDLARNLVAVAAVLEAIAVGFATLTARSEELSWQMRALRLLPMFLVPTFAAAIYSGLNRLMKLLDQRDHNTLEKLRAERKAKIDELKERTNYYMTQQLIQRYDLDPTAKAAAASVLASKLGSDSGLKVFVGDEPTMDPSLMSKSKDMQLPASTGLRQRKPSQLKSVSTGSSPVAQLTNRSFYQDSEDSQGNAGPVEMHVEHYRGPVVNDVGWLARLAALLVGEDPTQCYALICGNCHMHNGLARKEDFPFITYYCPHCHALNGSHQSEEHDSSSAVSVAGTPTSQADSHAANHNGSFDGSASGSPLAAGLLEPIQEPSGIKAEDQDASAADEGESSSPLAVSDAQTNKAAAAAS